MGLVWKAEIAEHYRQKSGSDGPELVLFDLDGTLVDSVYDLAAAIDHMLVSLNRPPVGSERVRDWVGNGADMLVRRALAGGVETEAMSLDEALLDRARPLFDQAYLSAICDATGVYDGVESLLAGLEQLGVGFGMVTNKPRHFTEPLLASLGWSNRFSPVVCGDDIAERKPSPAPVLHACKVAATEPSKALMVGDSRNDIGSARAAGVASVAVPYGYNHGEDIRDSQPDWLVDRLDDLLRE